MFVRFVGFPFEESPDGWQLRMVLTLWENGSGGDTDFHVAAKIFVLAGSRVQFSIAKQGRQPFENLPSKNFKYGLAFPALSEMGVFPIQKLKISTCRLSLRPVKKTERLDVSCLHGVAPEQCKEPISSALTQQSAS